MKVSAIVDPKSLYQEFFLQAAGLNHAARNSSDRSAARIA